MVRGSIGKLLVAVALLTLTTTATSANETTFGARAMLTGFQEVPPKLTDGAGSFKATVSGSSIAFTLTYSGLSTPAFMSHLHFGQRAVNGGVFVWLCGTLGGKPACPDGTTTPATVTGTITAADVVAIAPDQGVSAGDFAAVIRILQSGDAYVNVHTARFPGGEIRGQVSAAESDGEA